MGLLGTGWHLRWAWNEGLLGRQLGEVFALGLFFLGPVISSSFLQLPQWFLGWFLGMQCRAHDLWWSELSMIGGLCLYIHGIAVYGRTPLTTCEYAYSMAVDQPRCPFLDCESGKPAGPPIPPNWRNCSAPSEFFLQ